MMRYPGRSTYMPEEGGEIKDLRIKIELLGARRRRNKRLWGPEMRSRRVRKGGVWVWGRKKRIGIGSGSASFFFRILCLFDSFFLSFVYKVPAPETNHVNERTVTAAMPTMNLRACRSMSETAALQPAQTKSARGEKQSLLEIGKTVYQNKKK